MKICWGVNWFEIAVDSVPPVIWECQALHVTCWIIGTQCRESKKWFWVDCKFSDGIMYIISLICQRSKGCLAWPRPVRSSAQHQNDGEFGLKLICSQTVTVSNHQITDCEKKNLMPVRTCVFLHNRSPNLAEQDHTTRILGRVSGLANFHRTLKVYRYIIYFQSQICSHERCILKTAILYHLFQQQLLCVVALLIIEHSCNAWEWQEVRR